MQVDCITITLPLPPRELSPNRPAATRAGRMAKSRATKSYRERAYVETLSAGGAFRGWQSATAQLRFYWPDKRRRDIRNAEHAMKAAYDGVVDAGLIPDDDAAHLSHGPTEFHVDRDAPRVEITIQQNKGHGC